MFDFEFLNTILMTELLELAFHAIECSSFIQLVRFREARCEQLSLLEEPQSTGCTAKTWSHNRWTGNRTETGVILLHKTARQKLYDVKIISNNFSARDIKTITDKLFLATEDYFVDRKAFKDGAIKLLFRY